MMQMKTMPSGFVSCHVVRQPATASRANHAACCLIARLSALADTGTKLGGMIHG